LGIERARASKGQGLTLAAVMVFLYSVMVPFFSNLGNMGIVPAVIAACLPLLLTTVAMSVLIRIRQAEG
jgi:lipopolysaccharide export LptBFGC system permease protein LptF